MVIGEMKHLTYITDMQPVFQKNTPANAKDNRNNYKTFYNEGGRVDWQQEMLRIGKA